MAVDNSGMFGGLVQGAISAYGLEQYKDDIEASTAASNASLDSLSNTLKTDNQFKPFTVASSTGNVGVDTKGGHQVTLSPEQFALQQQLQAGAGTMFERAMGSTDVREGGIYDKIRAMQNPEEQEAMYDTEQRAQAQGRLGLALNAYGGSTPEMMALQRGVGENQNRASVSAIDLARQQQMQDFTMGQGMLTGQYAGENQLLANLERGTNNANLSSVRGMDNYGMMTDLGLAKTTNQANSDARIADILSQQYAAAGQVGGSIVGGKDAGTSWTDYAKQVLGF